MHKQKQIFILIALVLAIAVVTFASLFLKKGDSAYQQKQLQSVKVLETTDFSSSPVRFMLQVQSHGDILQTPEKIILRDKSSNKVLELPLVPSANPQQCASHDGMDQAMMAMMRKWDTDWFSVEGLGDFDTTYTSKLSSKYSVEIDYNEGENQKYLSVNSIDGVCYQVPKTVRITPNPKEEIKEN